MQSVTPEFYATPSAVHFNNPLTCSSNVRCSFIFSQKLKLKFLLMTHDSFPFQKNIAGSSSSNGVAANAGPSLLAC